jgi:hypothetical protein
VILLLSIGLSFVIALLTGGHLSGLARVPFKLGWLTFVALGLQVAAIYTVKPEWLPGVVLVSSYALLGVVVLANIRTPGVALIALGLAANLAVISANGGFMPVTPEAVSLIGMDHLISVTEAGNKVFGSKDIVLSYSDTNLWALSDIVVIRWPYPAIFSLGDLTLAAGAFWFIQAGLHTSPPSASTSSDRGVTHEDSGQGDSVVS